MWLLEGYRAPDHNMIARFIKSVDMPAVMVRVNKLLIEIHQKIKVWRRLYRSLGEDISPLLKLVGSNDFSTQNYKNCGDNLTIKKMFVWNLSYLAILRNIEALGQDILDYLIHEVCFVYQEMIRYVIDSQHTQYSALTGILKVRGRNFIDDILLAFIEKPEWSSNIFDALFKAQKENKSIILDTRALDIALRYRQAGVLSIAEYKNLCKASLAGEEQKVLKKLRVKLPALRDALAQANDEEIAKTIVIEKIEETLGKIEAVFKRMEG